MTRPLIPGPGEPAAGSFAARPFGTWVRELIALAGDHVHRPRLIAIDGRGGAGKSTISERIADVVPATTIVHTDDVAWRYSMFDWGDAMREHILEPLHRGLPVDYRPAAWHEHGRSGSIRIERGTSTVLVEGTGIIRDELAALFDASIWMQSDAEEARRRALDRDVASGVNGDREAATAFWDLWQEEEVPFFARERPWARADFIVAGTPVVPLAETELAVTRAGE
ncbi:uridine kinase family protein [Diaminobutyricimonas aerilata]|nr:hypothetical protein [Diaminobutyricimonas aerilata]